MIHTDSGDFYASLVCEHPVVVFFFFEMIFQTPEFYFNCCPPPLCCLHIKLDAAVGKALLPTAASPKEMGKHTRTASSPPSAAVNERGCCCQVSCEFETAAERTHCALTTQSGIAAARLPGCLAAWLPGCLAQQAPSDTQMISHTHTHDEELYAKIMDGI